MIYILYILAYLFYFSGNSTLHADQMTTPSTNKEIIRSFLLEVRSGKHPEKANVYMAETILAHQIQAENPVTVKRTPANYEAHIREFLALFGDYELEITELLADGDKVYARWIQRGKHVAEIDGHKPTGKVLVEFTSVVYLLVDGKITEYWLQTDRAGMEMQLKGEAIAH